VRHRALVGCIAFLLIATGYLGYRVVSLKRSLRRAEYFVQVGLVSVQQACTPVINVIRREALPLYDLRTLASGCFGQTNGVPEADEFQLAMKSAAAMADLVEEKLRVRRRLPWRDLEPVSRERMPVDYYDEDARIPE
jgi:hypothetical protein